MTKRFNSLPAYNRPHNELNDIEKCIESAGIFIWAEPAKIQFETLMAERKLLIDTLTQARSALASWTGATAGEALTKIDAVLQGIKEQA